VGLDTGVATALSAFSTLMAAQLTVVSKGASPDWFTLATLNSTYWYTWALFTPAIIWLARQFRFERQAWRKSLPVHLVGTTVFTVAHVAAMTSVRWWLWLGEPKGTFIWSQYFKMTLLQYFDWPRSRIGRSSGSAWRRPTITSRRTAR